MLDELKTKCNAVYGQAIQLLEENVSQEVKEESKAVKENN